MKTVLLISASLAMAYAQRDVVGDRVQGPGTKVDNSAAGHTLPAKVGLGANKPVVCTVGEEYFATDAVPGQNVLHCSPTNVWTAQFAGGPIYPASSGTFKVAPYPAAVAGAGNCCKSQAGDYTMMNHGNTFRFPRNGYSSRVKFSWDAAAAMPDGHVYFQIFRERGGSNSYDLVGQTEDMLTHTLVTGLNTVTLDRPIAVQEGDFYGVQMTGTNVANGPMFRSAYPGGINKIFAFSSATSPDVPASAAYPWESQTGSLDEAVIVEWYMAESPGFACFGDSITSGYNSWYSSSDTLNAGSTTGANVTSQYCFQLGQLLHSTYQNMGRTGDKSTDLLTRVTDVIGASPKMVVISVGINDVRVGVQMVNFHNNMTGVLDAVTAAGIVPVVMLILPCSPASCSDAQMITRDTFNVELATLVNAHPGAVLVDAGPHTGAARASGPAGNLWNQLPLYNNGDDIHFNLLGETAIAQAIYDTLEKTPRQTIYYH